jgi:hypothetical protein
VVLVFFGLYLRGGKKKKEAKKWLLSYCFKSTFFCQFFSQIFIFFPKCGRFSQKWNWNFLAKKAPMLLVLDE